MHKVLVFVLPISTLVLRRVLALPGLQPKLSPQCSSIAQVAGYWLFVNPPFLEKRLDHKEALHHSYFPK